MGKSIPYAHRLKIVQRMELGHTYEQIAGDLCCSISGVKKIWGLYRKNGESAFTTVYANCGRRSPYPQEVRDAVNGLRDNGQGASYVRSKLLQKHPASPAPDDRTLQRWWAAERTARPKGRPPAAEKKVERKGT